MGSIGVLIILEYSTYLLKEGQRRTAHIAAETKKMANKN